MSQNELLTNKIKNLQKKLFKKKKEILRLTNKVDLLLFEKEELIENFEITTNLLIEKLKNLSLKNENFKNEERPQTSKLIKNLFNKNKDGKFFKFKKNIDFEKGKLSFKKKLYSQIELGKTQKKKNINENIKHNILENNSLKNNSKINSSLKLSNNLKNNSTLEISKSILNSNNDVITRCLNCEEYFNNSKIYEHLLICFRKVKKCIYCNEIKLKNEYKNHIKNFLDGEMIKIIIKNKNLKKLKKFLNHNFDINQIIENKKSILKSNFTFSRRK